MLVVSLIHSVFTFIECLFVSTVIVIGLNPVTQEVTEGNRAVMNMEILFGSLSKDVVVTLTTADESAKGMVDILLLTVMIDLFCISIGTKYLVKFKSDKGLTYQQTYTC